MYFFCDFFLCCNLFLILNFRWWEVIDYFVWDNNFFGDDESVWYISVLFVVIFNDWFWNVVFGNLVLSYWIYSNFVLELYVINFYWFKEFWRFCGYDVISVFFVEVVVMLVKLYGERMIWVMVRGIGVIKWNIYLIVIFFRYMLLLFLCGCFGFGLVSNIFLSCGFEGFW